MHWRTRVAEQNQVTEILEEVLESKLEWTKAFLEIPGSRHWRAGAGSEWA